MAFPFMADQTTEKHLAGGKFDHDQRAHGLRYGANMSTSRARRMAREDPARWADYKRRAREHRSRKPAGHKMTGPEIRSAFKAIGDKHRDSIREAGQLTFQLKGEIETLRRRMVEVDQMMGRAEAKGDAQRFDDLAALNRELEVKQVLKAMEYQRAIVEAERVQAVAIAEAHEYLALPADQRGKLRAQVDDFGPEHLAEIEKGRSFVESVVSKEIMPVDEADIYETARGTHYTPRPEQLIAAGLSPEKRHGVYLNPYARGESEFTLGTKTTHELGHWIEEENYAVKTTVSNWLRQQVERFPTTDGDHYTTRKGSEYWPRGGYAGLIRVFSAGPNMPNFYVFETLAVALEMFYKDPLEFARLYPEYFDFALGLLRGNFTLKELTEKHLAGGKFDHDQRAHGLRYGKNMSTSRARRMARQDPERWADYKRRARERRGKASAGSRDPQQIHAQVMKIYHARNKATRPLRDRVDQLRDRQKATEREMLDSRLGDPDGHQQAIENNRQAIRELDAARDQLTAIEADYNRQAHEVLALPEDQRGTAQYRLRPYKDDSLSQYVRFDHGADDLIRPGAEIVEKMVHKDLLDQAGETAVRPWYRGHASAGYISKKFEDWLNDPGLVDRAGGGGGILLGHSVMDKYTIVRAFIHEFGHHLEINVPGLRKRINEWYDKHTNFVEVKGNRYTYARKKHHWFYDYAGVRRKRGREFTTELLSVGLEKFFTDPLDFARMDPEHFAFILSIISGEFTLKELTEKHLAGGKFDHDQRTHGLRYGKNMSTSRARRMAREEPGRWADYKRRARERRAKLAARRQPAGQDFRAGHELTPPQLRMRLAKMGKRHAAERQPLEAEVEKMTAELGELQAELFGNRARMDIQQLRAAEARVHSAVAQANHKIKELEDMKERQAAEARRELYLPPEKQGKIKWEVVAFREMEHQAEVRQGIEFMEKTVHKDLLPEKVRVERIFMDGTHYVPGEEAHRLAFEDPGQKGVYVNATRHKTYRSLAPQITHEIGHQIEDEQPTVASAIRNWYEEVTGIQPSKTVNNYKAGKFSLPFRGKKPSEGWARAGYAGQYTKMGRWLSFEVLSVAMELFFEDPVGFAAKFPEHFNFALQLIRGDFSGLAEISQQLSFLDVLKEWAETLKHLAGGKFDHDQGTHGLRYGANMSTSRARRMARENPEKWRDYQRRAREKRGLPEATRGQRRSAALSRAETRMKAIAPKLEEIRKRQAAAHEAYGKRRSAKVDEMTEIADQLKAEHGDLYKRRRSARDYYNMLIDDPRTDYMDADVQAARKKLDALNAEVELVEKPLVDALDAINQVDADWHKEKDAFAAEARKLYELPADQRGTINATIAPDVEPGWKSSVDEGTRWLTAVVHKDVLPEDTTVPILEAGNSSQSFYVMKDALERTQEFDEADAALAAERQGVNIKDLGTTSARWHSGTVVHELGHWLDNEHPDNAKAVLEYFDGRVSRSYYERIGPRALQYRAKRGKWVDAYAGTEYKFASGLRITEALSVGLQWLFRDPLAFERKDPDLYAFIIAFLSGGFSMKEAQTEKHLGGSKFDHDQSSHGRRASSAATVRRAKKYAERVHADQKYAGDRPYMYHVEKVASHFKDPTLKTIAYLHDVIEDDLTISAADMRKEFGSRVASALEALEHRKPPKYAEREDNLDYLKRLSKNIDAIRVKIADSTENLHFSVYVKPHKRLAQKYRDTLAYLEEVLRQLGLTEKHLAGGKFAHDQTTHGLRYGANMSTSRARRMARENPEKWADYKRRARAHRARQPAAAGSVLDEKVTDWRAVGSPGKSKTYIGTTKSGRKVVAKPVEDLYYPPDNGYQYQVEIYVSSLSGADFDVAAGDISESYGWGVAPKADIIRAGPDRPDLLGTQLIKEFVEGEVLAESEIVPTIDSVQKVYVIENLLGQADGHPHNYVTQEDGTLVGIDFNISGSGVLRSEAEDMAKQHYWDSNPQAGFSMSASEGTRNAFYFQHGMNKWISWNDFNWGNYIPLSAPLGRFLLAKGVNALKFSPAVPSGLQRVIKDRLRRILNAIERQGEPVNGFFLIPTL